MRVEDYNIQVFEDTRQKSRTKYGDAGLLVRQRLGYYEIPSHHFSDCQCF